MTATGSGRTLESTFGTPINSYQASHRVRTEQLCDFCEALMLAAPPAAVTISSYDPEVDSDVRGRAAALRIATTLFWLGSIVTATGSVIPFPEKQHSQCPFAIVRIARHC
jgi:hypothetical protein